MTELIWFKDPRGFVSGPSLVKFFPATDMTLVEKLNALLRLSLYFSIALLILGRGPNALIAPLLVAVVTFIVYTGTCTNLTKLSSKSAIEPANEPFAKDAHPMSKTTSRKKCTQPTRDNPFMNVLPLDPPTRGPACDIQAPGVANKVERLFDQGLLARDSDDIFNRNSNSRQFVANPVTTITNDQTGFARWLFKVDTAVKGHDPEN